jgi:tetratricopeptide (TPR) repeat protein
VKRFAAILFVAIVPSLFPQNRTLDSLQNMLPALQGKHRLEVLYELSNQLEGVVPQKAKAYGVEGLELALMLGDSASAATLLSSLSYSSSELGDFADALRYGSESLHMSTAIGDKKRIASANSTLGIAYVYMGQYSKALSHHLEALRLREELELNVPTANTLNNIGIAYHNIGQYDKAIEYYKRGLERHGPAMNSLIRARYLTNIGFSEFKRGNLDSAKMNYTEALKLAARSKYGIIQAYLYFNLGTLYMETGEYSSALGYLMRSLQNYTVLGQKHGKVQLYNALAQVHFRTRNYPVALKFLDSAVVVAKEINVPDQLKSSYETYFRIYQKTGPLEKEYFYYRQFANAKDSLMNSSESKRIAEVLFNREIMEKQRQIELLRKEKTIAELSSEQKTYRTNVLYGGILLAFGAILFLYRVNLKNSKKNDVIAQKNEELKQVNDELQQKIGEVNLLSGFLPICSNCKKIRDDDGEWEQMEAYISKRSEATFSHGICPDCMKALYGTVLKRYNP